MLERDMQISRLHAEASRAAQSAALPDGMLAVAQETRIALASVTEFAHSRFVELQMAVEPQLVVAAHVAEYRTCLHRLLLGAIGRANTGVLVTAMPQADCVEIAVLDDGVVPAGARLDDLTEVGSDPSVPPGGTLTVSHHPAQGTTILLRLPRPDSPSLPQPTEAAEQFGASAES
jgi:hypothetical protein